MKRGMCFAAGLAVAGLGAASASLAQEGRFRVVGDTLYFNGDVPRAGSDETGMARSDASELGAYIMEQPEITTVDLRSEGGSSDAGLRMAESIKRFGLKTSVTAGCYSACTFAFLGGSVRTLHPGGVLGFHRSKTSADGYRAFVREGIDDLRVDAVATFAFDLGIDAFVEDARFFESRGLSTDFILRVFATPPRETWVPAREELVAAGVLNDW